MLILSRHRDEEIVINAFTQAGEPAQIVVAVAEIRGDKVRLGIEAPKEVPVHRREVYDAIKREQARGTIAREPMTNERAKD